MQKQSDWVWGGLPDAARAPGGARGSGDDTCHAVSNEVRGLALLRPVPCIKPALAAPPPVSQIDLLRQHSSLSTLLSSARDALIQEVRAPRLG